MLRRRFLVILVISTDTKEKSFSPFLTFILFSLLKQQFNYRNSFKLSSWCMTWSLSIFVGNFGEHSFVQLNNLQSYVNSPEPVSPTME